MKKVGRRPMLTPQERMQLGVEYAEYQRLTQEYLRRIRELSPQALARRYGISKGTVHDYANGRHKREPRNPGSTALAPAPRSPAHAGT